MFNLYIHCSKLMCCISKNWGAHKIYIFVFTAVCWLTCEVCDMDEIIRRSTKWKFHAYIIIAFGTSLLIGLSYWLKLYLSLEYLYRNLWSCIILFFNFLVWIFGRPVLCSLGWNAARISTCKCEMQFPSKHGIWHLIFGRCTFCHLGWNCIWLWIP